MPVDGFLCSMHSEIFTRVSDMVVSSSPSLNPKGIFLYNLRQNIRTFYRTKFATGPAKDRSVHYAHKLSSLKMRGIPSAVTNVTGLHLIGRTKSILNSDTLNILVRKVG